MLMGILIDLFQVVVVLSDRIGCINNRSSSYEHLSVVTERGPLGTASVVQIRPNSESSHCDERARSWKSRLKTRWPMQ